MMTARFREDREGVGRLDLFFTRPQVKVSAARLRRTGRTQSARFREQPAQVGKGDSLLTGIDPEQDWTEGRGLQPARPTVASRARV
jgi:hypothetical protein